MPYIPQVELHREGKNSGSFFQDQKFGKHEIFRANKFVQQPQIFSHSCRIESQRIYQIDYIVIPRCTKKDEKKTDELKCIRTRYLMKFAIC